MSEKIICVKKDVFLLIINLFINWFYLANTATELNHFTMFLNMFLVMRRVPKFPEIYKKNY